MVCAFCAFVGILVLFFGMVAQGRDVKERVQVRERPRHAAMTMRRVHAPRRAAWEMHARDAPPS